MEDASPSRFFRFLVSWGYCDSDNGGVFFAGAFAVDLVGAGLVVVVIDGGGICVCVGIGIGVEDEGVGDAHDGSKSRFVEGECCAES